MIKESYESPTYYFAEFFWLEILSDVLQDSYHIQVHEKDYQVKDHARQYLLLYVLSLQ